jgi:hypothetical protein
MTPDQIERLAKDIVSESIQNSWGYWLLVAGLLVVATFLGSYLSKYAARRAEHKADQVELKAILQKVEQTTRVTESIKSVVSLGEWTERERRTLKRDKLEELVFKAYSVYDWLSKARSRLLSIDGLGDSQPDWWALDTVTTLGVLYFPDLQAPIERFSGGCNKYYGTIWSVYADLLSVRQGSEDERVGARLEAKYKRSPELDVASAEVKDSLRALSESAAEVMKSLIEVPQTTN